MNPTDIETLSAMLRQEATYATADYVSRASDLDADCRAKVAQWCYQVVDFCKFSRESVEIAMSHLDRFLLTEQGQTCLADRNLYQLACMTSLYSTIKINEPEAIDPETVSQLSRGAYKPEDIEANERQILMALQWKVNPVTSIAFVREYFKLIPEFCLTDSEKESILETSKFQCELAVADYKCINSKPSYIAYCSFMNAMESVLDGQVVNYIGTILRRALDIKTETTMKDYLFDMAISSEPQLINKPKRRRMSVESSNKLRRSEHSSPRSAMQTS